MSDKIDFLVKLRDASQMLAEAANEYLLSLAPPEVREDQGTAPVQETMFNILKFEPQQGARLGEFEIAHEAANLEDKWRPAYKILRNNNATIKDRHKGDAYTYSYWLYGENKIYRQKIKQQVT